LKDNERVSQEIEVMVHNLDSSAFPKTDNPVTMRVIRLFSDAGRPLAVDEIASVLSVNISSVQYCVDLLIDRDLIVQTRAGFESSWTERNFPDLYVLTPRGREYVRELECVDYQNSEDVVS
jgi:DNA-binding MarR family transcriptional regulator